ncbi:unnamed protein product [Paramecium pentaurelia]|uniref:Protein kinase domain-containing protein n=1 Tax=Paramecium pentaurelia TaxID=43138 RepID=A0A8S1V4J2_9CILI|nr:unnamed protein product [Paramecium pentaurelia]
MARYAKKPINKYTQPTDANRRVQTEAADVDDIDLQQAILKFKNLQEKQKTPLKNQRTKSKSPAPQQGNQPIDYSQFTFTSLKVIGQGSFGIVYKAKVNETGEIVAVKKVIQDKRYKNREIQILQELDHPNIVETKHAYFTYGDSPDEQYLNVIMDYQPETLHSYNAQFLKQQQLLPEIQAKLYSYQLLRGIAFVHTKGICHRDIKPHNVLINPDTNVLKICDFGSAKKLSPLEPNIAYICSRCYRAPELLFGATNYTTQVDMWSVGCIIGEMFNGLPLFLGASAVDQLVEIIKILGSPSKDEVLSMNELYDIKQYKIVQIRKKDWRKVFQTVVDPSAIDLISKILTYCPKTRLTALQALTHSYFDDLRDETTFRMYQSKIQIPDLFDFTKEELSNNQSLANKLIPKWYQKRNKC